MEFEDYIDFHTHHPSLGGERVIQDGVDTRGRHPWHLLPLLTPHPLPPAPILAIGESGLDRLCQTPYDLQLQVFREEVRLSEERHLPLFLHCVRAIDDVLHIRKELRARQPWIWHGYRGNAQQLRQLLKLSEQALLPSGGAGKGAFYFSFGPRFNTEALLACPADRLLLETDEDTQHPIADLYAKVACLRGISIDELIRQMHQNFHTLFGED